MERDGERWDTCKSWEKWQPQDGFYKRLEGTADTLHYWIETVYRNTDLQFHYFTDAHETHFTSWCGNTAQRLSGSAARRLGGSAVYHTKQRLSFFDSFDSQFILVRFMAHHISSFICHKVSRHIPPSWSWYYERDDMGEFLVACNRVFNGPLGRSHRSGRSLASQRLALLCSLLLLSSWSHSLSCGMVIVNSGIQIAERREAAPLENVWNLFNVLI